MTARQGGSPRPTFAGTALIRRSDAVHFLWGDAGAGQVEDWIYVSSDRIHMLVFGLGPEAWFRHSESHRTIFGADELYYVLSGTLVLANPETGEVHRARAGEAVFFRRDTWHHGFAEGPEPLRVLELFSPPPSQGTSQAYARTKPYLDRPRYVQNELVGRWPAAAAEARGGDTMRVLREEDLRFRCEGAQQEALVGLLVSTEHLTAGRLRLAPGRASGPRHHAGDAILYLLEGGAEVRVPGEGAPWRLEPHDAVYLPIGREHELVATGAGATFLLGTAPGYSPGGAPADPLDPAKEA